MFSFSIKKKKKKAEEISWLFFLWMLLYLDVMLGTAAAFLLTAQDKAQTDEGKSREKQAWSPVVLGIDTALTFII